MSKTFWIVALCLLCWAPVAGGRQNPWVTNDEKGVRILIDYLEKEDPVAVRLALDSLACLGKKAKLAIPAIKKTLQHPDGCLRIEAAQTLLDLNVETDSAIRTIREAAKNKDAKVRPHAVDVIGRIANPPPVIAFSCWGPGPRPSRAFPEIGKAAIPELCDALHDPVGKVRAGAAHSLGRIGNHAAPVVPGLVKALNDSEPLVALAAATAPKEFGRSAKDAVPALRAIVERRDKTLELSAVAALYSIDEKEFYRSALPVLLDALHAKGSSPSDPAGFLMTCWVAQGKDAAKVIDELLMDDDPSVRCVGVRSLQNCPATKGGLIPACAKALRDPHHWVRQTAVRSLCEVTEKSDALARALMNALGDEDDKVRSDAIYGLMHVGRRPEGAFPILMRMAKDPNENSDVRMAAARALWHVGADEKTVLAILVPMLRHERYEWRRNAAFSLGDMKEKAKPAFAALVERLKNDQYLVIDGAIYAIRQIGPEAVADSIKTLIASLNDADPKVRRTVLLSLSFIDTKQRRTRRDRSAPQSRRELAYAYIGCLGRMQAKAKDAVPIILRLTRDPDEEVRRYARGLAGKNRPVGRWTAGAVIQRIFTIWVRIEAGALPSSKNVSRTIWTGPIPG